MKITTTLHETVNSEGIRVQLVEKHVIGIDANGKVNPKVISEFKYEVSEVTKLGTNHRFNTNVIHGNKGQFVLFAKLNRVQRFKLRLMFGDNHLQKHWKFYIGTVFIPLFIGLGLSAKCQDLLEMIRTGLNNALR